MAQDFYDILQPFDFIVKLLRDNQATLGIKHIAENQEQLLPEYPAILVQADHTHRENHATRQFYVRHHIDVWVFHADLTVSQATRSRKDIELATAVRKLLHSKIDLDGHIVQGHVGSEDPGFAARVIENQASFCVVTRLAWEGELRVPYEAS